MLIQRKLKSGIGFTSICLSLMVIASTSYAAFDIKLVSISGLQGAKKIIDTCNAESFIELDKWVVTASLTAGLAGADARDVDGIIGLGEHYRLIYRDIIYLERMGIVTLNEKEQYQFDAQKFLDKYDELVRWTNEKSEKRLMRFKKAGDLMMTYPCVVIPEELQARFYEIYPEYRPKE